ncbi:ribosomal protein S12 methylthiotransferase accessory factor [Methanococcus voltae PS]|uniref:Ribosomal protein S12 methylthiotransferase accessory factor n=2 Tax=Methanococcus voltae TaxID=2188 RepID=A0ABT2EX32_METVO|nr:YcaO-related McrA-glycine thioamidation protein [Methanococcus voltae]MCS3922209.1 ribosomal protein S12 methylthiotransferase accessory factor [Methanococcus voltae PS]
MDNLQKDTNSKNITDTNSTNTKINYTLAAYRLCTPEETMEKVEPILKRIGVTRTARIDGLDRIGIPVYSSIRPEAKEGAISVYAGKGATETQAKVSSSMEAIERYCAEQDEHTLLKSTNNPKNPLELSELIIPNLNMLITPKLNNNPKTDADNDKDNTDKDNKHKNKENKENKDNNTNMDNGKLDDNYSLNNSNLNLSAVEWVEGYDITNDEYVDVPANSVFHPYEANTGKWLFRSNTNGLASGNSYEEAVFHGILEVVERDAWSISELSRNTYRKINLQNAKNPLIHEMLLKFRKAKINVIIKDLTSEVGIPTVACISDEDVLKDPALLCMGVGCHLDPEIAVIRALTEVAQSRATQIHGAREDTVRADLIRKVEYDRMKRIQRRWFNHKEEIDIAEIKNCASYDLKTDIETVKTMLKDNGFDKIVVLNLNKATVDDVNVVRVIIPKMEVYAVDDARISKDVKERIKTNLLGTRKII